MSNPYQAPQANLKPEHRRSLPTVGKVSRWILIYLAIAPLIIGIDYFTLLMPNMPLFVHMRQVALPVMLAWIAAGLAAALLAFVLPRRIGLVFWLTIPYAPFYLGARYFAFLGFSNYMLMLVVLCLALPVLLRIAMVQDRDSVQAL